MRPITIILISFVTLFSSTLTLLAQDSSELSPETLCKKWRYVKSEMDDVVLTSEGESENDMLWLKADMTYESLEEGVPLQGTWAVSDDKQSVELLDNTFKETNILLVKQLNDGTLVYEQSVAGMTVTMFMEASNQGD